MDMMTGGFDARALRMNAGPVSFAPTRPPVRALPRWADWRFLAGGATLLMLGALAFVPMPEADAGKAASAPASTASAPVAAPPKPEFETVTEIVFDFRLEEGRSFAAALQHAGIRREEARAAAALVARALEMEPEVGTRVDVRLGWTGKDGTRPLEELSVVSRGWRVTVSAKARGDGFTVASHPLPPPIDGTRRIAGIAGDGLYWALREAGVGPSAARDYLMALNTRIDVGEMDAGDKFDLVLVPAGDRAVLVYAGLARRDGRSFELVRLGIGDQTRWIDSEGRDGKESDLGWPSGARVTSTFGMRRHPILGYARMHSGIDFAAPMGSPILATADGVVADAGWAGGHGRRVMVNHESGLQTSYSHMSRIAVTRGTPVRRGDVVGYVGSSGLSTGAHLHYEVHQGGRAVDPRSVGGITSRPLSGDALEKVRARLAAYKQLDVDA